MATGKIFTVFLALSVTTMSDCSLLEMSQTLWAKLVSGGLAKVGQLDPLRVPVIKVDQSEGNTSYRMVLRDVEINGLNNSILESIHIARGRLRSNLSELESGYVSYADLRGLDSIKYRFHTLLKQPLRPDDAAAEDSLSASKQDRFERLRQYDPEPSRLRDGQAEDSISSAAPGRARQYDSQYSRIQQAYQSGQRDSQYSRDRDGQYQPAQRPSHLGAPGQYDSQYSRDRDSQYEETQRPSHLGGAGEYDSQYSRDRDGPYRQPGQYDSQYTRTQAGELQPARQGGSRPHDSQYPRPQEGLGRQGSQFVVTGQYDSQYSRVRTEPLQPASQRGESARYASQPSSGRAQQFEQSHAGAQFRSSERYDSENARYQASERQQTRPGGEYRVPIQSETQQSASQRLAQAREQHYRAEQRARYNSESPKAQYEQIQRERAEYDQDPRNIDDSSTTTTSVNRQGRVGVKGGYQGLRAHVDPVSGSIYMRGSRIQTFNAPQKSAALKAGQEDLSNVGSRYPAGVDVIYAESALRAAEKAEKLRQDDKDCKDSHVGDADISASENVETKVPSKPRLEDQPGYIDIVYADGKGNGTIKHFGNLRIESSRDKKVYNLDDIMKDLRNNRGLLAHNLTNGETLTSRNQAARDSLLSGRLRDLIRYASGYQEAEGFFEEGMQLIYHYGNQRAKNGAEGRRTKRAHLEDAEEDDVMHIALRVRVPTLHVKSQYQLNGKVGPEILRGTGSMSGNFTDLIGDFTVELKRAGDDLMIVRAARAKLMARNRNISLEGMDSKGPVESIFNYGLMAAEAVAAMLADDLATKALTDKSADAMVYKLYRDLPDA